MQYRLQIILLLSLVSYNTSIFSQRATSKKATSVYLSIPPYNLETANPNKFNYSFAMGKTSFKTPKIFESKEVCVASGSKNIIKDAKNIKVFKYSVPAEIKNAFLIIETPKGDILYTEEFNNFKKTGSLINQTIKVIYGEKKCYWHPQVLEKTWKEDQKEWKKIQHEKIKAGIFENAQKIAQSIFKFGYVNYSVNVYTGKGGKGNDYSELNEAQKQAIATYNKIAKEGVINQQSINQLTIPINTWLKYVDQINLNNKKAKINRKVAQGLYLNLATAYFQIRDFKKAIKYLGLHGDTYSNPTFKGTDQGIIYLSKLITDQQRGLTANTKLSKDFTVLNKKIKSTRKVNIQVEDLGEAMANELETRHHFYSKEAKKKASITASGGSIYKKNIRQGRYGSTLIMMTMYDGDLNKFPIEVTQLDVKGMVFTGGYSFTNIPAEIGNMTNLIEINLTASSVSSIPEAIGKLVNLKKLNLSRTQIKSLPQSIKNLKNLKELNIKKTKISAAELAKIKSWLPKKCKIKA
ncbi:hypothetical protein MC378_12735 [Polaribacter sp. MSW13]|uniref:Leucine rich repeat-containing protein n=1 Tax=Polaribacter marinus TaxID=2916838 RepID=A0A9X2AKG4_9FLAO|nr:leucine-rich repeat domain-containing protein [Polaribacter marinus]MCI2230037.1 hypothetical protein [Polaribacter marinus]